MLGLSYSYIGQLMCTPEYMYMYMYVCTDYRAYEY